MIRLHRIALLSSIFLLAARSVFAASAEKTEEISWDSSPGTTVVVGTTNGDIRARTSTDQKLHVKARKVATGSDPALVDKALERVKIEVKKVKDRLTVSTDVPADVKGGGLWSTLFGKDVTVTVHYEILVPEGSYLELATVNGDIDCLGLADELKVKGVNGSVSVAGHGAPITAETVNGSLSVEIVRALPSGKVRLSTVNGAIDLEMSKATRGTIKVDSLNGSIQTDFPVQVQKNMVGSEIDGNLNGGEGISISIDSLNGTIRVMELPAAGAAKAE
ncbi:MAG: hypothetical protein U0166_05115 [Acidobacteriota bacterium]